MCIALLHLVGNGKFVTVYDRALYFPLQTVRGYLFSWVPISLGDLLYVAAGCWLAATLFRWARWLAHLRNSYFPFGASVLKAAIAWTGGYLVFLLGWGLNYEKPQLVAYWKLMPDQLGQTDTSREARLQKAHANLVRFSDFLVGRLNEYARDYQPLSADESDKLAADFYQAYTNCQVGRRGTRVKTSLFSPALDRLGIEGYYNPFTGEGQRSKGIPLFALPFLICHEMAHQAGIGSEEDANLLSYALCTTAPDRNFRYSAYLEIWQYAYHRLYRRDSATALAFAARLNPLTHAHLDSLDKLSRLYQNSLADYSSSLYDGYLRAHDQKEGIHSYAHVLTSAFLLEEKRRKERLALNIP